MLRLSLNKIEPWHSMWKQIRRNPRHVWEREHRTWLQKTQSLVPVSFLPLPWESGTFKNLAVSLTTRWQGTWRSDCVTSQARRCLWKVITHFIDEKARCKEIGSYELLLFHTYHALNTALKVNNIFSVDLLFLRIKWLFGLSLIF